MIKNSFYIPIFEWNTTIIQIESEQDEQEVLYFLSQWVGWEEVNLKKVKNLIKNKHNDGGQVITYYNNSVILLYPFTCIEKKETNNRP